MASERLDITQVFTRIFETYRDQAGLFLPAALAVFIPVAILSALARGGVASSVVFGALAAVLSLIATYAYQGMVVEAVRDIQDGVRDFTLGSLFRSVAPVLLPLLGASILAGLGIGVGLILLVVPGLILVTWWALLAPSIVLERRGMIDAFRRSRELVRGNGWQVFGVVAIVFLIQLVLSAILTAVIAVFAASPVGSAIASLLTSTLVAPVSAIAAAVMFLELRRMRGEAPLSAGVEGGTEAPLTAAPAGAGATGGRPFEGATEGGDRPLEPGPGRASQPLPGPRSSDPHGEPGPEPGDGSPPR